MPEGAIGIVLFAHGSGSSRLSPRNQYVAQALQQAGIGTLLFDLLTDEEATDRENVFDIDFLAHRLGDATRWLRAGRDTNAYALGYFGASTGSAAALTAAAQDYTIRAVVSRGGRPDLALRHLADVRAPTLLIVGGRDYGVIELNEKAYRLLRCEKSLQIVPAPPICLRKRERWSRWRTSQTNGLSAIWQARRQPASQPAIRSCFRTA